MEKKSKEGIIHLFYCTLSQQIGEAIGIKSTLRKRAERETKRN